MGFNINFNNNQPMIRESQKSQDGGAGNTGYFESDEDAERKKKQQSAGSIFGSLDEEKDSFQHEGEDEKISMSFSETIAKLWISIKCQVKKLFNLK